MTNPVYSINTSVLHTLSKPLLHICTGIIFSLVLCVPQAHAALFADNEARTTILDLRTRYEAIQRENQEMRASIEALKTQVETLQKNMMQYRNREAQLQRDMHSLRETLDSTNLTSNPTDDNPAFSGGSLNAAAESKNLDAILVYFRSNDYTKARAELRKYLANNPSPKQRVSALYWLGNAEYGLRNHHNAILHYRNVIIQAPDHVRAPQAMLALASCQLELQDTTAAKRTLQRLIEKYPTAKAARVAKTRLARLS